MVDRISLVEIVGGHVSDKKLGEISHLRDEANRTAIRIAIDLKRDASRQLHDWTLYLQAVNVIVDSQFSCPPWSFHSTSWRNNRKHVSPDSCSGESYFEKIPGMHTHVGEGILCGDYQG